MKHVILSIIVVTMSSQIIAKGWTEVPTSSDVLANEIVHALIEGDAEKYLALFPTLENFHDLMEKNAVIYGDRLPAAKSEFGQQYQQQILPSVKAAFQKAIDEGKSIGVDWNTVKVIGVETSSGLRDIGAGSLVIVFTSAERTYKLQLDNVMVFGKQWKAGSRLSFKG